MRKNIILKVLTILFCFFAIEVVQAESCSTKELNELRLLAKNIKINYELYDDTYNEAHRYYFSVSTINFGKEFYLIDSDGQDFRYMPNLEKNGVRDLRVVQEGINYQLTVYTSNETSCPNTKIMTKKVEIPYYNDYSAREECKGIEDFSLCQRYYDGYIESEKYFLEQVEKYKNGEINEDNEEETTWDKVVSFISNNLLIVIPVSIVLISVIVIVIIKVIKSKRRTKIRI